MSILSLTIVTFQSTIVRVKKNDFLQLFCSHIFAVMVTEVKVLIKGSAGRGHVQNYNRKVAMIQPFTMATISLTGDRAKVEGKEESFQLCSIAFACFSKSTYII